MVGVDLDIVEFKTGTVRPVSCSTFCFHTREPSQAFTACTYPFQLVKYTIPSYTAGVPVTNPAALNFHFSPRLDAVEGLILDSLEAYLRLYTSPPWFSQFPGREGLLVWYLYGN